MNPTPERLQHDAILNSLQERSIGLSEMAQRLVQRGAELGFVITVTPVPQLPPAMGNFNLEVEVRLHRETQKMVTQLEQAATMSEQARDCAEGSTNEGCSCAQGQCCPVCDPDVYRAPD